MGVKWSTSRSARYALLNILVIATAFVSVQLPGPVRAYVVTLLLPAMLGFSLPVWRSAAESAPRAFNRLLYRAVSWEAIALAGAGFSVATLCRLAGFVVAAGVVGAASAFVTGFVFGAYVTGRSARSVSANLSRPPTFLANGAAATLVVAAVACILGALLWPTALFIRFALALNGLLCFLATGAFVRWQRRDANASRPA